MRLADIRRLPDVLAFSDGAALAALGGGVPDLPDVISWAKGAGVEAALSGDPSVLLRRGADLVQPLVEQIQRVIDYARDLPQLFEGQIQRLKDIASAAIGGAGASVALSFWTSIVQIGLQLQRERADDNLRRTIGERRRREAAALSYFTGAGIPTATRGQLPAGGVTPSIRDVGGGRAPVIASALKGSPFWFAALPLQQQQQLLATGFDPRLGRWPASGVWLPPESALEPRCDVVEIWRERGSCFTTENALVLCTPWAWPLAVDPQWSLLGTQGAALPVPDPDLWLPIAGSYVIASPAHLMLDVSRVLQLREALRSVIATVGSGWYVGPGGLQRLREDASWPRFGAWLQSRNWSAPAGAAPDAAVLMSALGRIDRVLEVRRWCVDNFGRLPVAWQQLATERNGQAPPPAGFRGVRPARSPIPFPGRPRPAGPGGIKA